MMSNGWDFDVAVVGGGPGGSSVATALARRGRGVVLLERERFPRFHIGESQPPWSNEVFRALGAEEAIAAAGFVRKWGASPEGVTLRFASADGIERTTRVGAVVDASGRAGILASASGGTSMTRCSATSPSMLSTRGSRARRAPAPVTSGCSRRPDMGWLRLIPLSDSVMSVGAVIPREVHRQQAQPTAEDSLAHYLADTPAIVRLLEQARCISPARFDADYSYLATRMAGDRWVAVGDAAAFLDPIFSTGVFLAMQGGLEAAEAVDVGLRRGNASAGAFARYERIVRKRYHHFRRFAVGFYDPAFRELWFTPRKRFGIYGAIVAVLAGNWRPSSLTRARIEVFFALVAMQRLARRWTAASFC